MTPACRRSQDSHAESSILKNVKYLALALLIAAALPADSPAGEQTVIRGELLASASTEADHRLKTDDGKVWDLVVETDAFHALHDPKLAGRTWEFVGYAQDGDKFDVRKLFTIKDGKRHEVTYYCEICHIVSYRPGMCMCCQEDVELRELPAEE